MTMKKIDSPAFVSKKFIARRTLLRGAGASLALPLLDAMTPAFAQSAQPIHRFQTVYIPNGMAMEYGPLPITALSLNLRPFSSRCAGLGTSCYFYLV